MKSTPTKSAKLKGRKPSYIMITHRPAENSLNVVHVTTGYELLGQSEVKLTVDGKSYAMFIDGQNAWSRDVATDHIIVRAMRTGKQPMTVRGQTKKGQALTDTYSLNGVSKAWDALNKACRVNGQ